MITTVSMASPTWNKSSSYGRIAREGRAYLKSKGIHVNTLGADSPNPVFKLSWHNFLHGYPTNLNAYGDITKYGFRMIQTAFESSRIPDSWIAPLNELDAVIVPSRWNKQVFEDCGVKAPIYYVPEGVSSAYHYVERKQKDIFRFITIADRGHRKGFIEAICAFVGAFGARTDVELIVKARELPEDSAMLNLTNKNIRVINQEYSDEEMQILYARSDCMIFPAHGEGFGLPPREFAVTGGISLCTDYGGLADELPQWGIGVAYKEVPAWPFPPAGSEEFFHLGMWADCDVEALVEKLLTVYNMSYSERITKGKSFSDFASGFYRWENYGDAALRLLEGEPIYAHQ